MDTKELILPASIDTPVKRLDLVVCGKFDTEFKECVASGYVYDTNRIIPKDMVPNLILYRCVHFWIYRDPETWYVKYEGHIRVPDREGM